MFSLTVLAQELKRSKAKNHKSTRMAIIGIIITVPALIIIGMGLVDKFRKRREEEEKYEEVPEEEELSPSSKNSFISKLNPKVVGIFVGAAGLLFIGSRLMGGQEGVVIKGDPEAQKMLLEEVLKSQKQMNEQILNELKAINQKLEGAGKEDKVEPKKEEKKEEKAPQSPTSGVTIIEPPSTPPPPPPPPLTTPAYSEPVQVEPYKPKINRIERKDEDKDKSSKADGVLLAQASVEGSKGEQKQAQGQGQAKTVYLPAGTTLKGKIINSFPAPVGGEKFPAVLIELEGHARLPNNYRLDLSRCLVVAKGEGSYILERAKMETYKLTCILKNGKVIEVAPKGMIVSGEDGIEGVAGKFLNVNREQLLTYLGGTTLSGFFSALQQGQTEKQSTVFGTTTNIKNEFLYALYGSLAQTWNEFARWYLEEAKKILPVVVVQAGKPVYIVLVDGVSLEVSVDELKKNL